MFPKGTSERAVLDALLLRGFHKTSFSPFFHSDNGTHAFSWFDAVDYRSHTGIYAELAQRDGNLSLYVRSRVFASYWDLVEQNELLRQLRSKLKATFQSDYGGNRYFPLPVRRPEPAESGSELAFAGFQDAASRAMAYLGFRQFPASLRAGTQAELLGSNNPLVLSNNLLLPYLIAILEDYFKSTFIALFRYSPLKETVLKGARLTGDQLARISDAHLTVEEAFVETVSFQNLSAVASHFKSLEPKLDLLGVLKRPYRRRKRSLLESISATISMRHEFIHRGLVVEELSEEAIVAALSDIEVGVGRFYQKLADLRVWPVTISVPRRKAPGGGA